MTAIHANEQQLKIVLRPAFKRAIEASALKSVLYLEKVPAALSPECYAVILRGSVPEEEKGAFDQPVCKISYASLWRVS